MVIFVPVYCLTKLSAEECVSYTRSIIEDDRKDGALDHIQPKLEPWSRDRDGDLQDMYQLWRETAGDEEPYHFAFFIDRQAVEHLSLIVAQPDPDTMVYSKEAIQWASARLRAYVDSQEDLVELYGDSPDATQVAERHMESLDEDILGKRGLTYGRVPASAFKSIWANLEITNMSMEELVRHLGRSDVQEEGIVQMVTNLTWNEDVFIAKLELLVRQDLEKEAKSEKPL